MEDYGSGRPCLWFSGIPLAALLQVDWGAERARAEAGRPVRRLCEHPSERRWWFDKDREADDNQKRFSF